MTDTHDRVIDVLGNRTFPFALELGAGEGSLTERLAPRCGRLITLDPSPAAVEAARARLETVPNVDARVGTWPADLPAWTFDLVVCRDIAVPIDALERIMPRAATLLAIDALPAAQQGELAARPGLVRVASVTVDGRLIGRFERR